MGDAGTTQAHFEPPPGLLAKVQALYDQGLCRQAHALASASAPLADWRGVEGDILAGRAWPSMRFLRLRRQEKLGATWL